ncbi:uncharacterized protein BXZ73DRAFT_107395 [Epithele typhae]|uniref:uncharacterized protein n=1 Tax=Epithele typhae TaxID=378194 RepID=UPI0020079C5A|nr:uncharacterized protein BXZ73DRAFT_107395 [Epithele typhae]KAH9912502.1 hypothetical protein BXZ73DRAFT_107395 [Epithele typhae]
MDAVRELKITKERLEDAAQELEEETTKLKEVRETLAKGSETVAAVEWPSLQTGAYIPKNTYTGVGTAPAASVPLPPALSAARDGASVMDRQIMVRGLSLSKSGGAKTREVEIIARAGAAMEGLAKKGIVPPPEIAVKFTAVTIQERGDVVLMTSTTEAARWLREVSSEPFAHIRKKRSAREPRPGLGIARLLPVIAGRALERSSVMTDDTEVARAAASTTLAPTELSRA